MWQDVNNVQVIDLNVMAERKHERWKEMRRRQREAKEEKASEGWRSVAFFTAKTEERSDVRIAIAIFRCQNMDCHLA